MDNEQANGFINSASAVRDLIQSDKLLDEWPGYRQLLIENMGQKPAWFFTLPVISCLAVGGASKYVIPVVAAWISLDHASHLLDTVGDGDYTPDEGISSPGQAINYATSLIFAGFHFLSYIQAPEIASRVMRLFVDAGYKATFGQHLSYAKIATMPVEEATNLYWRIIILKSGSIFRVSTAGGAAAGTADEQRIDALGDFGTAIGVITQMMDDCRDILDLSTGEFEVSLPVLLYSLAKGGRKIIFPEAGSKDAMIEVLQDTHVPEMIAALIQEWQKNALDSLKPLPNSSMVESLKSILFDVSKLPLLDNRIS